MNVFKDLTGQRFGYLTVIGKSEDPKMWNCQCDCGKKIVRKASILNAGRSKACSYSCCNRFKNENEIIGKKYGKVTPIKYIGVKNGRTQWLCKCECGNEVIKDYSELKRSRSLVSCGCAVKSINGLYKHRLYRIHHGMESRCYCKKYSGYQDYGGRGITVCSEWRGKTGFLNFYEWSLKNGYKDNLSIDRLDVNGNYEPSNCRWATRKEQSNNTRKNVLIEYKGKSQTLARWARELGINRKTLEKRLKNGHNVEEAFETPAGELKRIDRK